MFVNKDTVLKIISNNEGAIAMNIEDKIYVAGHKGLVGSAIYRRLRQCGYQYIATRTRGELDLRNQAEVEAFFQAEKPQYVFVAAAKVGGILANNSKPADFIYENLMIQNNVLHSAYQHGVKKLLFLGSSCIYPKMAPQPIKEEYLLTGSLEPTNEPYAIAKIAGIKLCEAYNRQYNMNFLSVLPTNIYGINDNFDLNSSHVLPALIRKFHEAKVGNKPSVEVWGTGKPRREFLFADDLADACVFLMERYQYSDLGGSVNIGVGDDLSIADLADVIKEEVGYKGEIVFNTSMPDGTPRKLLDVSLVNKLGWRASTTLREGIALTYSWYKQNI